MDSRHLKEEGNIFSDTRTASPALFIRLKANRIRTAGFGVFVSPQTTSKQKKKSKVTYSCRSFPLSVGGFVDRCQLCWHYSPLLLLLLLPGLLLFLADYNFWWRHFALNWVNSLQKREKLQGRQWRESAEKVKAPLGSIFRRSVAVNWIVWCTLWGHSLCAHGIYLWQNERTYLDGFCAADGWQK